MRLCFRTVQYRSSLEYAENVPGKNVLSNEKKMQIIRKYLLTCSYIYFFFITHHKHPVVDVSIKNFIGLIFV